MEWLTTLVSRAAKLFPRPVIVDPNEEACLTRCGKVRRTVGPGIYLLLPIIDEAYITVVAAQNIDITDVRGMTKDNSPVSASGVIEYHIVDIESALFLVLDYDQSIKDRAAGCLRRELRSWDGESDEELEDRVLLALTLIADPWGICVDEFVLNGLQPTTCFDITLHRAASIEAVE